MTSTKRPANSVSARSYPPGRSCNTGLLLLCLAVAAGCQSNVKAQRIDFTYTSYGLGVDADNVIQNAAHLDGFYEALYQLQLTGESRVNIIHIGDSHIQADYMTSIVRRHFHRHFGNAGRGLIVPLRVAGTNEPANFKSVSGRRWQSKRCVFPDQPLPIGVGGITVQTQDPEATIRIFMNDLWLDYSFDKLTLFFEEDENSFDFDIRDTKGTTLGRIVSNPQDSTVNHSDISWEKPVDAIEIQPVKSASHQSRAVLYGMVLEKAGSSGVLYHTIGVNGAKYKHYNAAEKFARQTAALYPQLFIISLGTNESIDYPYVDKALTAQIDKLITSLREQNPAASFILVTPQEAFRNRNKPNPGVEEVRQQIIRYAVENGLAFYDMYRAVGGASSASAWRENSLLSVDGIHLTRDGYEYEGNLFYHALIKGYNSYVPHRHP